VKLLYVKFVSVIIVVCVRTRRRRREEEEKEPGIQNQKQEPHTKMWGKKSVTLRTSVLKASILGALCPNQKRVFALTTSVIRDTMPGVFCNDTLRTSVLKAAILRALCPNQKRAVH